MPAFSNPVAFAPLMTLSLPGRIVPAPLAWRGEKSGKIG